MTATTTVMYSLLELIRSKKLTETANVVDVKRLDFFVPALAALLTMTITVLTFITFREFMRRRKDEEIRSVTVKRVLNRGSSINREKRSE
jgi:hypothetical protein